MRRKMITVSAALALMLSVAGCTDKASMETTPAASVTTTEAVNVTADDTTEAPATTLADETTAATITATAADITPAETTTAPVTTAEETEAIEPDIPLNAEYFPDEGFRRLVSEFDQDQDGYLSPKEREAVTELECLIGYYSREDASSTHSLAGIQYFSELNTLRCAGLNLPELDLSHNPELKELHCYDLKLLSELDLTQNLKLEKLEISLLGINELDLSHNSELKELDIYNLSLSELDLSHNSELKRLYCHDFDLTKLDVSHNLELELLDCHYLGLTELDVTQNLELEVLNCSNLGLTELDVTQNRKLTTLHCDNNKLTVLDLSNNDALTQLECYSNQLTSLDLSANQNLVSLNCVANSMTELNLSGLSKLKSVKCFCNPSLKINANNISSADEIIIINFNIDDTASISSNTNTDGRTIFRLEKRYNHAPIEDGYYYAKLIGESEIEDSTQYYYSTGFECDGSFTGASADQNIQTIRDARLSTYNLSYYSSYDCGTVSLPMAQTVKYEYNNHTSVDETNIDNVDDFNTFYSMMNEVCRKCFFEESIGELSLSIHILNGSIDEISIGVYQYP